MTPIRYIRKAVFGDISQAEFARLIGRRPSTVCCWETGRNDIGLQDLREIRAIARRKRLPWSDTAPFHSDAFLAKQAPTATPKKKKPGRLTLDRLTRGGQISDT